MYTVTFYQCAVIGIPDEHYQTIREARLAASDFLRGFQGMPGHKRVKSVYRDNYARYVDYSGGTEAMAEITKD